ncbi:MAG TPA: CHRD domain-containing protein [Candidatus Dormibacteraeota bacterium]
MRKGHLLAIGLLGVTLWLMPPSASAATTATTNEQANMTGPQETSPPGPANAMGVAKITIDDVANTICYSLTYAGISKPTAAHIHVGARGVAGPVVVDFNYIKNGDKGCVPADPTVVKQVRDAPAGYYVNVHTAEYPKGAIRGQLAKV